MDHEVAQLDDIPDGGMRPVDMAGICVLLSRDGQEVSAVGAHCSHQGAPLGEGLRVGRHVICPWHHAMFDLHNGDHIEPPGEGSLTKFEAHVEDGKVIVALESERVQEQRAEIGDLKNHKDRPVFVIVGAGAAGRTAAEELRRQGFDGRILLISAETDPPYDRTSLSKSFLAGEMLLEDIQILSCETLAQRGIELLLDTRVAKIDAGLKKIIYETGGELTYDACLAAPGYSAREPDISDLNLRGVYSLRSKSDGLRLKAAAKEANKIVIIGSGFIGMETAAVFAEEKKLVTVLTPDSKPFAKQFGPQIAEALIEAHRAAGVTIQLETKVTGLEGKDGHVTCVRLESGEFVPADLVVIGIGAKPEIDFIQGIHESKDGGIETDATLQAAEGLWVAGDIASFPSRFADGGLIRVEHWRLAEQLGRHAARAMLGDKRPFTQAPFFWTKQHWQLALIGYPNGYEDIHIEGDVAGGNFMAYYIKAGQIIAGLGAGEGDKTVPLHALYLGEEMPSAKALSAAGWDPAKLLA